MKPTKRMLVISVLLSLSVLLAGCIGPIDIDVYENPGDYDHVWYELPERDTVATLQTKSLIFPEHIEGLNVKKFYAWYGLHALGGSSYQILLSVEYEAEAFAAECQRLMAYEEQRLNTAEQKDLSYWFDKPVAVTLWNVRSGFEYALMDEETCQIHYVYLQYANPGLIQIAEEYLPKDYETVYRSEIEEGYDAYEAYRVWKQ